MQYKVISKYPIWVKDTPELNGRNISVLYKDTIVTAIDTKDTWIQISKGWVNTKSADGEYTYLQELESYNRSIENSYNTSTLSVGDTVSITSEEATYLDTGEIIPDSVKSSSYQVSAMSEDGSIALLDFPAGARILTQSRNLTREAEKDTTTVTKEEIETPSNQDPNKEDKYDSNGTPVEGVAETSWANRGVDFVHEMFADPTDYYAKTTANSFARILDNGISISTVRGIFGMPYQYMSIADRRITSAEGGTIGRKYAEKIIARMPLMVITPGLPEFMPGQSDSQKNTVIDYAVKYVTGDNNKNTIDDLIKRSGKYYTLRPDRPLYFNYVNPMCRIGARFLNIQNETIDGVTLDKYSWDTYRNAELYNTLTYKSGLAFYIHSETQVSDNFNNNDTQSQLASKINGISEMGREINFLLGTMSSQTGVEFDKFTSERNLSRNEENNANFASRMTDSNLKAWFNNLTNQMEVVAAGGKLIFPNIWSDSSFGRSYDVTIKLVSPDYDILSWYLNIYVPLMHLMGLVVPRQHGYNGFISPFLVKAYYKGLFNCDLGLITSMNVTKGSEGGWTRNGLPTTVDVSLTIKDLYESLSITKTNGTIENNIIANTILMDYIANLCGININKPDIRRMIDFYYTQGLRNQAVDKIQLDIFGGFDQWATNKMLGVYNR